jgi:hypothetical protein
MTNKSKKLLLEIVAFELNYSVKDLKELQEIDIKSYYKMLDN